MADVFESVRQDGHASGRDRQAESYIGSLQQCVDAVAHRTQSIGYRPRVMLLEWINPPFCAGHWNPELVALGGGREVIGVSAQRSVTTPWEAIVAADPDVILIACCGFTVERTIQDLPTLRGYPGWDTLSCVQFNRVCVVDGSAYFSRPGPRLVDSFEILAHALHGDIHPLPVGLPAAIGLT